MVRQVLECHLERRGMCEEEDAGDGSTRHERESRIRPERRLMNALKGDVLVTGVNEEGTEDLACWNRQD
ncbi:hypothetical protein E2C01_030572 [Portunus trituberculatus]|uniref:Uncharacterized protein n=1 Tax=Portunus trituberculatus TaxID=210409 RepID=A0A5B7EVL9_PORTR|nr:hypothetical protein [Portunus trituberculatus]